MVNQSCVMMQKTDNRKDRVSFYRFWKNGQVTEKCLADICVSHCIEQCRETDHVLLTEDTSEINLERHRGRITDRAGLGLTGNNRDLVFFLIPPLRLMPLTVLFLGRSTFICGAVQKIKRNRFERGYQHLPIEERESYRRAERAVISAEQVSFCKRRTVVQDREGDIYESFCLLQPAVPDFVIRSSHDRKINVLSGKSLKTHIQSQCCIDEYMPEVSGSNRHRKKRMAQMELRYEKVSLCRPANAVWAKKYPWELEVYAVHVKEKADSVPHG